MTIKIAIRVDGSAQIGTGHVQRCLSLADALRTAGAEVVFVTRLGGSVVARLIEQRGFKHIKLSAGSPDYCPTQKNAPPHAKWAMVDWMVDAAEMITELDDGIDWVIVDHYAFDAHWHRAVANALQAKIAVIDDLGDRALAADIVVDHNPVENAAIKYAANRDSIRKLLTGTRFALLGSAYAEMPARVNNPKVDSIGIFMGGADADNISALMLKVCREMGYRGAIAIVSTSSNPNLADLKQSVAQDCNAILKIDQPNLAAFFAAHDLHIGAGGGATWERCCAGAPSIVMRTAANQSVVIEALRASGAASCCQSPDPEAIAAALKSLIGSLPLRQKLSTASAQMVDGKGCMRVAAAMLAANLAVLPATMDDAHMIHSWRNDVRTRSVSRDSKEIGLDQHLVWFANSLQNAQRHIWVGSIGAIPVGVVRFDQLAAASFEVSIFLNPELPGLGLGVPLLAAGEAALSELHQGHLEIHADTLSTNSASQAIFARQGYEGETSFVKTLHGNQAL